MSGDQKGACAWRVQGRVQRVGFRAATREAALALGLAGSAVNEADGSVLVRAFGDEAALDALHEYLRGGPPAARVDSLQVLDCDGPAPAGFTTG